MENNEKRGKLSASFIMGAVALAFLAIGYQTALFVHRATQLHILAAKEAPDTVYIIDRVFDTPEAASPESGAAGHHNGIVRYEQRRNASHSRPVQRVREQAEPRRYESFRFNPNTATIEDLKRLGFTQKQAESIDHYRKAAVSAARRILPNPSWWPIRCSGGWKPSSTFPKSTSTGPIRPPSTPFPASADTLPRRWYRTGSSWAAIPTPNN